MAICNVIESFDNRTTQGLVEKLRKNFGKYIVQNNNDSRLL